MQKLGRLIRFDERSKNFPVRATVPKRQRSYTWRCRSVLDQKSEGSCVGHGVAHELIARPAEATGIDHDYAVMIYHKAQKIDPWPGGDYENAFPYYEGSSVLAGVQVAQRLGWCSGYDWAFGLNDLILGVGYRGPAILGIKWYDGMFQPDAAGFIHVTGSEQGGHCILCNSVNIAKQRFTLHNSWGSEWGKNGECFISFADMDRLLREDGEAVFLSGRRKDPVAWDVG
jgi:hypothetical protein